MVLCYVWTVIQRLKSQTWLSIEQFPKVTDESEEQSKQYNSWVTEGGILFNFGRLVKMKNNKKS